MTAKVFLGDAVAVGAATPGSALLLDGSEGRHAAVVQRIRVGEQIDVVDGLGTRLRCSVTEAVGPTLRLTVETAMTEPVPEVRLMLVQALAKGDRDEQAIEAAVECGVDAVLPWQAERSVAVWRGERAEKSRRKWEAVVRAAVKQSRRAWSPPVAEVMTTRQLTTRVRKAVATGSVALILHESATNPLPPVMPPSIAEVLVIVGPEGGISEAEVAALTEAGGQAVHLGPHVMRTSTAGPVAIALLSERLGRWVSSVHE
ncbi:MAG: 16S rRNA (uracil(1498)-N(3))-methyltransferase [Promicromonosporaceae bacterium]|nr:16S rRNA (uracil(1498)-N(3))-methyltransferase [Promicromonosporaceae bacterium]